MYEGTDEGVGMVLMMATYLYIRIAKSCHTRDFALTDSRWLEMEHGLKDALQLRHRA